MLYINFGFNLEEICRKLGINLIPYSSYDNDKINLLKKFEEDGFSCLNYLNSKCEIYYNDDIKPKLRIKFTLSHELGHIVLGHIINKSRETHEEEQEANYFAREFYIPQAFLIYYKLDNVPDIMSNFNITHSYASLLLELLERRKDKTLREVEIKLIKIFEENKIKNAH